MGLARDMNSNPKKKSFNPIREFKEENLVTIGRLTGCTIQINDYGMSRVQSKITYSDNHWWVEDGDGVKNSTNGTWVYLQEPYLLKNTSYFKIKKTLFKIMVI